MFTDTINCDEAKRLINEENGILVDVRSPMEFAQGALPDALNVPLQSIQSAQETLERDRPLILYCVSGARTKMAKNYLESVGFENIHDVGSFRNYMSC
ncbi:MAG: rhodanese-like domain-containing protein [Thiotrichales bacterium]|jgi:phage shock protein E|nr:rhodanese-like domain-containing protein [Thiotrichales bacterium]MBT3612841.1 rhodanese-like domain-containing protein [Thiotrichales bacterium]MBT3752927.1 rhodanese-like domain-containing protein [Thiotrichales bacterium]MBT3837571.1 rhodanese-like domain-containing protein [Thiotrichales bacterium]MBT4151961.1 rhodanese-like domain-containing protein [Thiotrichales bacterium]